MVKQRASRPLASVGGRLFDGITGPLAPAPPVRPLAPDREVGSAVAALRPLHGAAAMTQPLLHCQPPGRAGCPGGRRRGDGGALVFREPDTGSDHIVGAGAGGCHPQPASPPSACATRLLGAGDATNRRKAGVVSLREDPPGVPQGVPT